MYKNNATDFGTRGGKIADSIDHNLNVDSVHWQASETSYKDSSLAYKGTRYEYPFGSNGFGTSSTQSRPSFLDILGVSRVPPYVPYGEPAKANTTGSFDISKVQSTGSSLSSPARHFAEFNTTDQSLKTMTPDFKSHKELSMDTLVSSNDGKLLQPPWDHHAQRDHQLFTSGKDEGFAALEQVHVFMICIFLPNVHGLLDIFLFVKLIHGLLDIFSFLFTRGNKVFFMLVQYFHNMFVLHITTLNQFLFFFKHGWSNTAIPHE